MYRFNKHYVYTTVLTMFRKVELVPYGPTWEDDGSEDAEAKKMASARKRLLSYKSDKLKNKVDEPESANKTPPPAPQVSAPSTFIKPTTSSVAAPLTQKTDTVSCKIPFVPTPDEIKEHPIFSNFASPKSVSSDRRVTVNPPSVGVACTTAITRPEISLNGSNLVGFDLVFSVNVQQTRVHCSREFQIFHFSQLLLFFRCRNLL